MQVVHNFQGILFFYLQLLSCPSWQLSQTPFGQDLLEKSRTKSPLLPWLVAVGRLENVNSVSSAVRGAQLTRPTARRWRRRLIEPIDKRRLISTPTAVYLQAEGGGEGFLYEKGFFFICFKKGVFSFKKIKRD